MSARHKLNQAYFNGALLAGGVVGLFCESWLVFGAVFLAVTVRHLADRALR